MPDIFGNPTEAELRGQSALPRGLFDHLMPPSPADLQARDAAARAGMGTVSTRPGEVLTGDEFRSSTDPRIRGLYDEMLQSGRSDPNLLFGGTDGRTQSDQERAYRNQYSDFMNNPNDGVSGSEAARAVGLWALAPIAGYAFGPGAAAGAAPAGAGAAGTGASITAGEAVIGGAGAAGTAALNASVPSLYSLGAGIGAGGMVANPGLGVFANGGEAGMAGVGGGNMGALAAEQAAATGGLGGLAGELTQNIASSYVKNLLSGGEQGGSMPVAMGGQMGSRMTPVSGPAPQAPLNQTQTRFRAYGRTPRQFNGVTVWM